MRLSRKKMLNGKLTLSIGNKDVLVNFPEEIEHTQRNGRAKTLQVICDAKDRYLNSPPSIGIINGVVGIRVNLKTQYGQHTTNVEFPGCIVSPEISFADDISYYRHETVKAFNCGDLSGFSRAYRGYLQSSISLVDCFLHRYTFHLKTMIPSTSKYNNTATLDSRSPIEDRLDAWMVTFATDSGDKFKNSKHRSKFIELKDQRNAMAHPTLPTIGYDAKEVVRYLNYAQEGVGGLLAELRKYSRETEYIGFIQQVKNQAKVSIIKTDKLHA